MYIQVVFVNSLVSTVLHVIELNTNTTFFFTNLNIDISAVGKCQNFHGKCLGSYPNHRQLGTVGSDLNTALLVYYITGRRLFIQVRLLELRDREGSQTGSVRSAHVPHDSTAAPAGGVLLQRSGVPPTPDQPEDRTEDAIGTIVTSETCRQTGCQTCRQTSRQTCRQTCRQTRRQTRRETSRQR